MLDRIQTVLAEVSRGFSLTVRRMTENYVKTDHHHFLKNSYFLTIIIGVL